jgi:sec-independent protein translocase protein TatA
MRARSRRRESGPVKFREDGKVFENLSLPHLLMVVAVAVLVFGPKRIPEIGGSIGKAIREFRKSVSAVGEDATSGLSDAPTSQATRESERATVPVEGSDPKRLLS